jgi:hypothetical protein
LVVRSVLAWDVGEWFAPWAAFSPLLVTARAGFGCKNLVRGRARLFIPCFSRQVAQKAVWALVIPQFGTAGMITRQLAQVGGIRPLRAANLRQLSSREAIGFDM